MKDITQSRLASGLMFGVGAWLMASPSFLEGTDAASTNALIVGGVIVAASLTQLLLGNTVPSWIAAAAAVWLLGTIFIFNASSGFVWSVVLSALATFVLAIWDGIEVSHIQHDIRHTAVQ